LPAIGQMDKVLSLEPSNLGALEMRGRLYLAQGTFSKAEQDFAELIKKAPAASSGYYHMGLLAQARNQPEEALKYFEESLSRQPDNLDALRRMAFIYLGQKKFEQAVARITAQVPKVRRTELLHALLGDIYQVQEQYNKARQEYEEALATNPKMVGPLMGLASVARAQNKLADAARYLDQVIKLAPRNAAVWVARGDVQEMMGQRKEALSSYRQALAEDGDHVPALNNLAYLLTLEGGDKNLNEALPLIQNAKRLAPGDPRILDTLGWVLNRRGAHRSALPELEEAAQLSPDNPTILYHLADTLAALNRAVQAVPHLKKALSLPGNFSERQKAEELLQKVTAKK